MKHLHRHVPGLGGGARRGREEGARRGGAKRGAKRGETSCLHSNLSPIVTVAPKLLRFSPTFKIPIRLLLFLKTFASS